MSPATHRLQLVLALALSSAAAHAQSTQIVSVTSGGVPANGSSEEALISSDGRYVLFRSLATNLDPLDTDPTFDAYLRDLQTGVTELISVDSNRVHHPGFNLPRAISADGNLVCFQSDSNSFAPGDTGGDSDLFIRDRAAGTTTMVSVDSSGVQGNGNSELGILTPDGRYLAFRSQAPNLVPGDTNNEWDVFVHDRLTGTTERVNLGPGSAQAHGDSYVTAMSDDGRYVLFSSLAADLVVNDTNNERDIFVRDRSMGLTRRISVSSAGVPSNGDSHAGFMSADGRFATFVSVADTLVPGDTNGSVDVFVHDLATSLTTRVSVSSTGAQANGFVTGNAISANGRFVSMDSTATTLVPSDTAVSDVFVHDRWTGQTTRASITANGSIPNMDSRGGAMSADGRFIAFYSLATNMGATVPGGFNQVYVRDRAPASPFATLCTGEAGAACPCANNSPAGANEGCLSSFQIGGRLRGAGAASLALDTLVLSGDQMPNAACLYFQGTTAQSSGLGTPFGDGLRCASGTVTRLRTTNNASGASHYPGAGDPSISVRGAVTSPGVRTYQIWYRNAASFCTPSTFNLTNGLWVMWTM